MTKLLHSAGLAVQALANSKSSSLSAENNTLESRKAAFKAATSQYFALLSSIDVRLRRQVYALEEADILAPDSTSRTGNSSGVNATGVSTTANPLEISWLNSRKDTVGKDKEAELWTAAREFVANLDQKSGGESQSVGDTEKMQVD